MVEVRKVSILVEPMVLSCQFTNEVDKKTTPSPSSCVSEVFVKKQGIVVVSYKYYLYSTEQALTVKDSDQGVGGCW